jgi:GAF domain-containing protein
VAPVSDLQASLGYRSLLLVPIIIRGEVVGALGADSVHDVHVFTEREVALVQAVADQLAIALENRRLLASTEEALAEAQALYDATRMVAALGGLEETLQAVVYGVARALPADQVALYALDLERSEVTSFVGHTTAAEEARSAGATHLPPVDFLSFEELMGGLTGWVLREGQPALSTKARPDPREGPEQQARRLRNEVGAIIVVPVRYGDKILGTLTAVNHADSPDFGQRDVGLMVAMANQAAVAMENARLFEETQIRAREQMILNQVGQALASCQDVTGVLDEVYAGAVRLLRGEQGEIEAEGKEHLSGGFYITLYDEDSQEITMALQVVDGHLDRPWTTIPQVGGLSEHLIHSRQPLLLEDRPLERLKEVGITVLPLLGDRTSASWLGVPIMLGDQVLGTIVALDFERERVYDEHSQEMLLALANRTALALQNVRLLAETRTALQEVEAAHRSYLRRGWQEYLHQQALLEESAFVYDSAPSGEPRPAGEDLAGASSPGVLAVRDFWRPEIEEALRGMAGPVSLPGMEAEGQPPSQEENEHKGLAVPISLRGQTLGVLGIEAPSDGREWTEEDRALIEAIGEQLAQTLESARLFAETQRRAERERLVSEISARIRASTDIRDILQTTAVELGRALGTSRALVRLVAEEEAGDEAQ